MNLLVLLMASIAIGVFLGRIVTTNVKTAVTLAVTPVQATMDFAVVP